MCSYREKKPDPTEIMQLDSFTVDYCEPMGGEYLFRTCVVYMHFVPKTMFELSCLKQKYALRAATNESQKTRNKKQNGLAHLQFLVCVTPKQKKHCLIQESSF